MLIKRLKSCQEIIAGDNSTLREILSPHKDDTKARYSIAHAFIKPGHVSTPHKLKSSEVFYYLEGEGEMVVGNESVKVEKDVAVYVPPNTVQYVKNTGSSNLTFLCIVDPAWKPEDEEVAH